MWFRAWLAVGKPTLLSGRCTTSRTTDSERVSSAGVVLLHGGKRERSTVSLNRRYAIAQRVPGSNDGGVSHPHQAFPENSVKDANPLQVVALMDSRSRSASG